ncbi:GSCOCG00001396001-RA-CDS, partial [Cotesia congregata]
MRFVVDTSSASVWLSSGLRRSTGASWTHQSNSWLSISSASRHSHHRKHIARPRLESILASGFLARRLERMAAFKAPAYGEDVPGVVLAPVIKGAAPAVEGYVDHVVLNCSHSGCSFLLSEPSKRSRNLGPRTPTTVAMQVDVRFLGS